MAKIVSKMFDGFEIVITYEYKGRMYKVKYPSEWGEQPTIAPKTQHIIAQKKIDRELAKEKQITIWDILKENNDGESEV